MKQNVGAEEKKFIKKGRMFWTFFFLVTEFIAIYDYFKVDSSSEVKNVLIIVALTLLVLYYPVFWFIGRFATKSVYYHTKLDLKDFIKVFFIRKECPFCQSKVKRLKRKIFLRRGEFKCGVGRSNMYGDIYNVDYYFKCRNCNRDIEISQFKDK